jgi:hypothetical protein
MWFIVGTTVGGYVLRVCCYSQLSEFCLFYSISIEASNFAFYKRISLQKLLRGLQRHALIFAYHQSLSLSISNSNSLT